MSAFTCDEVRAIIDELKASLAANAAAMATARSAMSFSLDTGQTRQSVMRQSLGPLRKERDAILSEIAYWDAMLNGTGAMRVVPNW